MGVRHVAILRRLGFSIGGIVDKNAECLNQAINQHDLPQTVKFSSAKTMFESVRPQAVVVATTATSHCELVCLAAVMGAKYILCEKPMAVSIAESEQMIATCHEQGAVLGVNHQMRYMEQYSAVKALASSPEFGGLRSVTVGASNFGLAMNGAHYFEMFRYLTGEEIEAVSFWPDVEKVPNPRGPQYEDRSGQVRGVTASGARLYIEIGGDLGHGVHVIYGCRTGQIFTDELGGYLRSVNREQEFSALPTTRYGMPALTHERPIAPADVIAPTEAVWRAILKGENFPDGSCGLHAVRALVAANISGERGGAPVPLSTLGGNARTFSWA